MNPKNFLKSEISVFHECYFVLIVRLHDLKLTMKVVKSLTNENKQAFNIFCEINRVGQIILDCQILKHKKVKNALVMHWPVGKPILDVDDTLVT